MSINQPSKQTILDIWYKELDGGRVPNSRNGRVQCFEILIQSLKDNGYEMSEIERFYSKVEEKAVNLEWKNRKGIQQWREQARVDYSYALKLIFNIQLSASPVSSEQREKYIKEVKEIEKAQSNENSVVSKEINEAPKRDPFEGMKEYDIEYDIELRKIFGMDHYE